MQVRARNTGAVKLGFHHGELHGSGASALTALLRCI